jgi:ATP/ADP translocase
MGSLGPVHWIIVLFVLATYIVPIAQVLRRVGFSSWLAVLALIPLVNLVLFWVFAFAPWPRDKTPPSGWEGEE